MTASAAKQMTKARANLLMEHPFFGSLALRLTIVEDTTIETACCDGHTLRYSPEYVDGLDLSETKGMIAHEVMHPALGHTTRRGSRDAKKWNKACDYAENPILIAAGFTLPKGALVNPAYTGTAEQIYTMLPEVDDKDDNNKGNDPGGTGGVADSPAGTNIEQEEAEWKMAVSQAAHIAKQAGNLPAYLKRLVDEVLTPVIPWRAVLRRFMTERSPDDFSWSRGNRRFLAQGIYLPSRIDIEHMGVMVVTIDTSGSIQQKELDEFASEITAIISETRPAKTIVIYCAAKIAHIDEFGPDDELTFAAHGGGGTDFRPPFAWLEEQGITPKAFVYLTDGYGPFPDQAPEFPVLWCINNKNVVPPHGEHVILGV
jgi:predicted metal-dependent peptidase